MLQSKEVVKKLFAVSVIMLILGFGLTCLGYSMSGFNMEKYQTNDKRWYQVISLPK